MKQSEAIRIPALLAARQPRPVVEEVTIEGIRMLVILGDEVDTGWDLDRMLYHFKNEVLARLGAGSQQKCS